MDSYIRAHITVSGVVQGVGYRFFAQRVATQLGITGYVRNLPDGRVEVVAEGKQGAMNAFIEELRRGPWSAHVSGFNLETSGYKGEFNRFTIRF
ncbi:MAG: acylphosphatase [Candidatus Latescibacterota bacterium]|nr:MAG: acylphosphatase [Candidatus Latescibacterota bacterium]RKY70675.1 MAG: acylphosphatase [Candidatus Latescibacterota bacterium]HDN67651.1 acylphosphatase [Bacillota bacterium]